MALTIQTVLYMIAALLALLAAFPIPTGSVNLLALAVAFLSLGTRLASLPDTEPVEVLYSPSGVPVVLPASMVEAIRWTRRKFDLMQNGLLADEAERIVRREMRAARTGKLL